MFQHLWSLAIEEQFYLVWPLALLGLLKLFGNRRLAMALVIFGGAALVPDLDVRSCSSRRSTPAAPTTAPTPGPSGLLLGAALALLWRPNTSWAGDDERKRRPLDLASAWAPSPCSSCASCRWRSSTRSSTGAASSWSASPRCVAIMSAVHPATVLGRFMLANPVLVWIGVRSYSLYLWHWPIFVFTRPELDQPLGLYPRSSLRLALTVVAAELSYRYVEVPIRNGAFRRWRQRLARRDGARRRTGPIALAWVGRRCCWSP